MSCVMRKNSNLHLIGSFWHSAKALAKEPTSLLFRPSKSTSKIIPVDQKIEEEAHDDVLKRRYYPVQIGDIMESKYQIIGKLGYGVGSTVWLAIELR